MISHRKLSLPLIAAKFIHTEKILKTMQIQLNSTHSLYSSKNLQVCSCQKCYCKKKKIKNTHQNMIKIKLKKNNK